MARPPRRPHPSIYTPPTLALSHILWSTDKEKPPRRYSSPGQTLGYMPYVDSSSLGIPT